MRLFSAKISTRNRLKLPPPNFSSFTDSKQGKTRSNEVNAVIPADTTAFIVKNLDKFNL